MMLERKNDTPGNHTGGGATRGGAEEKSNTGAHVVGGAKTGLGPTETQTRSGGANEIRSNQVWRPTRTR